MHNSDNQAESPAGQPVRKRLRRRRRSFSWRWISALVMTGSVLWFFGRPYQIYFQAESLLAENPRQAALLMEDIVTRSAGDTSAAAILWCRALLRSGSRNEALGCFKQFIEQEDVDSEKLLQLADDAIAANSPPLAAMSLDKIAHDDPHRTAALQKLIGISRQERNFAYVLTLSAELSDLQPRSADPWREMAAAHEQLLALPEAATDYAEFLKRAPGHEERVPALRSIVRILIQLGRREQARAHQDELLSLLTDNKLSITDQLNEAKLLRMAGNPDDAALQVRAIMERDQDHIPTLILRGTMSMEQGQFADAERDFRTVIGEQPYNKQARYKLATALVKLGRGKEAEQHFAENRRLQKLTMRILQLQRKRQLTPAERAELITILNATGLNNLAEQYR